MINVNSLHKSSETPELIQTNTRGHREVSTCRPVPNSQLCATDYLQVLTFQLEEDQAAKSEYTG